MAVLDVRNEAKEEITEIKFDNSRDRIRDYNGGIGIYKDSYNERFVLCAYEELDDLIAALKKAKELWG